MPGRAIGDERPLWAEHQGAIRQAGTLVEFVLDEQNSYPALQPGQRREELARAQRVEVGSRLVEHYHGGPHRQYRGEGQALLLAARKPVYAPRAHPAQASLGQRGVNACVHLGAGHAQIFEAEGDFVLDRQHAKLGFGVLKDDADARGDLAGGHCARVPPVEAYLAGHFDGEAVRDQTVERQRQRAFARPGGAEQQHARSLAHLERYVTQGRRGAAGVADGEG